MFIAFYPPIPESAHLLLECLPAHLFQILVAIIVSLDAIDIGSNLMHYTWGPKKKAFPLLPAYRIFWNNKPLKANPHLHEESP